jgi:two-component system nitrate/nitrite sensor histidine kinase NarX
MITLDHTIEPSRREQVADSLRRMLTVLNSGQPLEAILDHVMAEACVLLHAEAVAIYRLHAEQGLLTIQRAQGLELGYVADARIPVGQSVTGQAVLERRPVTLHDVAALTPDDALPLDRPRRALLERLGAQYRALIAVPLATEEVYGAITLYYQAPRAFSQEDVALAVAFSDQAALALRNAQLRAQVEQAAVASERRRLANDLHDSVTQVLFSASLTAEVLPTIWRRDPAEGERALEDLRELTRGALAEMRMLLLELRPTALQEAQLVDLLPQLAAAFTGRARVPVALDIQSGCDLPAEVRIAFFRIAQEALNNVAKHAEASQVSLSLHCQMIQTGAGRRLPEATLVIADDGQGFDPANTPPNHLGLDIVRERAEAIGAALTIASEPGRGASVKVTWRNARSE